MKYEIWNMLKKLMFSWINVFDYIYIKTSIDNETRVRILISSLFLLQFILLQLFA